MAAAEWSVEVVFSPRAGEVQQVAVTLPEGATVRQAIALSGFFDPPSAWESQPLSLGVWGRLKGPDECLRDHDRVEIYRALLVDPKEARRLRHRSHRESTKPRR